MNSSKQSRIIIPFGDTREGKDERNKRFKKTGELVFGSLIGNIMEFYDFVIYGYLSKYISKNFFPLDSESTSLLITFGVFAAGYLSRPLGSIIFGHIGDKLGRKKALLYSICLMIFSTLLIGLIPTYPQMGIFASFVLISLRILQGLAVWSVGT